MTKIQRSSLPPCGGGQAGGKDSALHATELSSSPAPPRKRKGNRALVGAAALATLLAACQTPKQASYLEYHSPQDPVTASSRLAQTVGACWFAAKRPEFADYSYAPELISYSGRPRVLVVPKAHPTGLPLLVIEASKADRGTSVKLFGPLLMTAEGPTIARDVERWTAGAMGC